MDKETRNAIQSATQKARRLLEDDFRDQLEGVYDVHADGTIAPKAGPHLSAREQRQRDRIVAAIEHKRAGGMKANESVLDYLRDAAFTTINRFVALKMLEARDIVQECISKGDASSGFAEFSGLAPGIRFPDGSGYRLYLECIFDELSTEVKVLFDRRDPSAVLWPKRSTFEQLLEILNAPELSGVWGEDETIGWVYQFFNGQDERRKMREESQAPRNSRELAIRNQFFTPRYVVQFLSDNTLGRIWYEMRNGDTRLRDLCEYMVRRPDETWEPRTKKDPRDMRVLDPACGSGHFLLYCFDLLLVMYEEAWADEASPESEVTGKTLRTDYPEIADLEAALPGLILRHNLHGVDIDPRCAQIGQLALWMRAQRAFKEFSIGRAERSIITRANIVIAEPMPGDKDLLKEFLAELKEDKLERLIRRALDVPADKRVRATKPMADSLAELVETVWEGMKLAGEMGTLLKIERDLARAIDKGRAEWEDTLPLFRVADYGLGGITKEKLVRVVPGEQEDFWTKAEKLVFQALAEYAAAASGTGNARRRLFAEDAAQGFALADLVAKRFDAVLMNPPFGAGSIRAKKDFERAYPRTKNDVYAAFVEQAIIMLTFRGRVGAITSRTGLFLSSFQKWGESVILSNAPPVIVADLGYGVMDSALVSAAAYCLEKSAPDAGVRPAVFFKLVDVADKETWLRKGLDSPDRRFEISCNKFLALPRTPFAYWAPQRIFSLFGGDQSFERPGRTAKQGLATGSDDRFIRAWWEVHPAERGKRTWVPLVKGGAPLLFYLDPATCVKWHRGGAELKAFASHYRESRGWGDQWSAMINASERYFEPGLTWSLRALRFAPAAMPTGCAFSTRGCAGLTDRSDLPWLIALLSSDCFDLLFKVLLGGFDRPEYTSGALQEMPVPEPSASKRAALRNLFFEGWRSQRASFTIVETSRAFLAATSENRNNAAAAFAALEQVRDGVNDLAMSIFGLSDSDLDQIRGAASLDGEFGGASSQASDEDETGEDEAAEAAAESLKSWLIGIAFGRFDCRLATGERANPSEPDPFDPLPWRSPGMYPESEEPADRPDIAVDDEGHPEDLAAHVQRWAEHVSVEVPADVRTWLAREFFPLHIKMYSKSRRKAPIYWQLATPSASYSVWLYIHAFTKDTLFRVQNDYAAGKLAHEERQLETLRAEAGPDPVTAQRKAIEVQEAFVDELRTFLDEVKRVAPLWNPNLDDGVIINFAPLWRLVPHHKPWQKELKSTWDALCAGKYDWAHLAMHLWPERVVPKCAEDRSLAIAHGLEDVFWYQDDDEKWQPREEPTRPIDALVQERTSSAVKAALKSLMEAPEQAGGARRGRGRRR